MTVCRDKPVSLRSIFAKSGPAALLLGVGHSAPPEAVPFVWRVDRASRDIDCPAGDTFPRQISADSVEPTVAKRSRNLLSHKNRNSLSCCAGGTEDSV